MDLDMAVRDYQRAVAAIEAAQQAAKRRLDVSRERADQARARLHEAMVEAALAGVRPVEIQRRTGYTKERVRQILREGGVTPAD